MRKDKRRELFRHSRPELRAFQFYNGDEYHNDVKILWVAHKKQPFHEFPEDMTQSDFAKKILHYEAELIVIDDYNKQYGGFGPVGVIWVLGDEWKIEPHVEFFPWATRRNILRGCVGFFHWAKHSRKFGCVLVYALKKSKNLFDHCQKYVDLWYVGKIPNGDPRGDEYLYSIRTRR